MTTYTFEGIKSRAEATFDCPSCGKKNRKRTFTAECTINPFNKNDDGTVKSRDQVRMQSREQAAAYRDQFMKEPLCKTCEDALSNSERRALDERRFAA